MSYPHPPNPPHDGQGGQQNPYPGGYGPAPGADPYHAPGGQPGQGGWPAAPSGPQQGYQQPQPGQYQQQYPSGPQQGYQYPQPGQQQYPSGPQQGYQQPQPGQYQQQYAPQQAPMGGGDEKQMALFAHLGGIISFLIPLILYLVKKEESPYVRHQSAQAFNFQLLMTIAHIVSGVLWIVLIGILTTLAILAVQIIFAIRASMATQQGEWYTYPFSIPALK